MGRVWGDLGGEFEGTVLFYYDALDGFSRVGCQVGSCFGREVVGDNNFIKRDIFILLHILYLPLCALRLLINTIKLSLRLIRLHRLKPPLATTLPP